MPTKESFSVAAQAEIADSLDDAREAHEESMAALTGQEGADTAAHFSYVYGSILYAFNDGEELSRGDLQMIVSALDRSIEVCADLDEAQADYESARAEVQNFL